MTKQQSQPQKSIAQVETAKPTEAAKNATTPAVKKEAAPAPVKANATSQASKQEPKVEEKPKTAVTPTSVAQKVEAKPAPKVEATKPAEAPKKE